MKKLLIVCMTIIGAVTLIGCSEMALTDEDKDDIKAIFVKDKDIKKLENELTSVAIEQIRDSFNKNISEKEYTFHFAEMVDEDSFKRISSVDTSKDIYIYGSAKNKPNDVVDFTMIYSNEKKEVKDLFLNTINNDEQLSMH